LKHAAHRCALIPSFLPVDTLVNLIAVDQMDPYDSDSSDGGSEFPLQPTVSFFDDPSYETYRRGMQFMIVDHTANQRNGSEVSKIWQHGRERRRVDDSSMDQYWR
jgi:hypothetical protein